MEVSLTLVTQILVLLVLEVWVIMHLLRAMMWVVSHLVRLEEKMWRKIGEERRIPPLLRTILLIFRRILLPFS